MSTALTTKNRRGVKPRFNRTEILAAALELLDADQPLTMRRLADHLGIGVMTLYGYVASKEELLEGVAGLLFDGVGAESDPAAGWEERVREMAIAIHEIVVRHPNLARALRAHRSPTPSLFRVRERMLDVLLDAGFPKEEAIEAMGILTVYAQGFASVQAASLDPEILTTRIRELPADDFGRLHECADVYASHISDGAFERGLELLLRGLRAELDASEQPR